MNKIKDIQNQDPLAIAEKITKKSYKDDESTALLGFELQIEKSKLMEKLMNEADDTKFSETTEEYLRKVTDFGFEVVYKEEFDSKGWSDEPVKENLYILWHKDYSILLVFDTFLGNRNGGNFYYNWSPNDMYDFGKYTSSGGVEGVYWKQDFSEQLVNPEESPKFQNISFEKWLMLDQEWSARNAEYIKNNNLRCVWVGNHDCREAIKNNITSMSENGVFLKKWKKQPFLWLLHHGDTKTEDYNYEELNQKRINLLPEYVREAICI